MTTTPLKIDSHTGPVVPRGTACLLKPVPVEGRHPGLQLDKFSSGGTQKDHQGDAVQAVCKAKGDRDALRWASARRTPLLAGATTFEARTEGPFTLHLSRASALENAGICLHPLYGFVYLPGSGLKGMARAWAESDGNVPEAEWRQVFGWAPDGKKIKDGHTGRVVFHDAWPTEWPELVADIVNNHHPKYYQDGDAPGDWMDPVPVQFLAVKPGTRFLFAIAPRRPGDEPVVEKAVDWLKHALALRGAGAKTNAGYGTMVPVEGTPPSAPESLLTLTTTLELTSPAFLAGARQYGEGAAEDCDLRPATLRGLLRWWWRTLHAGQMDVKALKAREALIWGDTTRGGAVRVTVAPEGRGRATTYDKDRVRAQEGLAPPRKGHTQGLFYASYGMDETASDRSGGGKSRRQRNWRAPGTCWKITLAATSTGSDLDARAALTEASAALWLLCQYGGVGSKARKGFGSFVDVSDQGASRFVERARARSLRIPEPETPALETAICAEWPVKGSAWQVLDMAWEAIEDLASAHKHDRAKVALGLPRQIHGPLKKGPLKHQDPTRWQPPMPLSAGKGTRHAAPYHLHVGRTSQGLQVLRFTGFPAPNLPNAADSRAMLERVRDALDATFGSAPSSGPGGRPRHGGGGSRAPGGRRFPCDGEVDGEPVTVHSEDSETYGVDYGDGSIEFEPKHRVVLK